AGRGTDPAAPVWHRHRHGRELSAGVRRLEPDTETGRVRARRARSRRASGGGDRGGGTGGPVRAFGARDSHGRLASAGRLEDPGNSRCKGRGRGRGRGKGEKRREAGGQASRAARPRRPFPEISETENATARSTGRYPGR